MNEIDYKTAHDLKTRKEEILKELRIWTEKIDGKHRLAYHQKEASNFAVELRTNIHDHIFHSFRSMAMENLRCQLIAIDAEFSEL